MQRSNHAEALEDVGTAPSLKNKGEMSRQRATGRRPCGSQWFRVGFRGRCSHENPNDTPQ